MSAEEAAPQPEPQAAPAEGEDDPAPEEEVTAQWESKYKDLKEVKVESGEEEDDILFKMRCKLFHFLKAEEKYGGQMEWKEKGVGALSLPIHFCAWLLVVSPGGGRL
jgi:Ran-binding protein 1|eukprot:COSAG03_NODE_701_length_6201_cov_4.227630_2_plen_107_part_00